MSSQVQVNARVVHYDVQKQVFQILLQVKPVSVMPIMKKHPAVAGADTD